MGAIFSLSKVGDQTPLVDWARGTAVFRLVDRNLPDLTEFNEKRDSVYSALLASKQQELYGRWFEDLIQNSEIENNTIRSRSQAY
jgi:hypothetical protein